MFVLDTVKKEPELEKSSITGRDLTARQCSPTTTHAENSKEPNTRKMNEKIVSSRKLVCHNLRPEIVSDNCHFSVEAVSLGEWRNISLPWSHFVCVRAAHNEVFRKCFQLDDISSPRLIIETTPCLD